MGMLPAMNEPPMLRAIRVEDEFRATVAKVYGADRADAEAQRLMEWLERNWHKDAQIVGSMMVEVLRVMRDENEPAKGRR